MTPRCDACRFWEVMDDEPLEEPDNREGLCKRHPPVPVALPDVVTGDWEVMGRWPLTIADDWCGEYQSHVTT